jgi:hypothetical protein
MFDEVMDDRIAQNLQKTALLYENINPFIPPSTEQM